jgi:hypothetical protein
LVLRELQRSLEARAEEVEECESSEAAAEVASVEGEVRRESRPTIDQDDEAEGIEARRIKAAADRDAPRVKTDHVEFDRRIRQEAADHTATRAYTAQQLRNAIIWREILGPPVALRGER